MLNTCSSLGIRLNWNVLTEFFFLIYGEKKCEEEEHEQHHDHPAETRP